MYKLAVSTVNDGANDMVVGWTLIPSTKVIPGTTDIELATLDDDFFKNYLDYYVSGGALFKLSTPANETWTKPLTNLDYPYAAVRATQFDIFATL